MLKMEEPFRNPSLTCKQRNCAQRNSLLRHTSQKINASIQSQHNQFERSMEFEAKKLRKKLTLMIPNAVNNARIRTTWKEENCEENGQNKLKLPVIKKESSSAPCSPTLAQRKSSFTWNNLNMLPPSPSPLMLRRASYNDISDSSRSSPLMRRKVSRSFSYRDGLRPALVPLSPPLPVSEDPNGRTSPSLIPRNLKLREQARREGLQKAEQTELESPQSPTLEDQFNSLGTCRYLRRATIEIVETLADEENGMAHERYNLKKESFPTAVTEEKVFF